MSDSAVSVVDDPQHNRYEVSLDGASAGFAAYRIEPERVVFLHTVVDPEMSGHGIGGALVRFALDDVRRQGKKVLPLCPFVSAYIADHSEYAGLVAG